MALSSVTITLDLADKVGDDFDAKSTKAWATTSADVVHDTEGNKTRVGSGNGDISDAGVVTWDVWVPGPGSNPAEWQTTFYVDVRDRNMTGGRKRLTFGPFTITAAANIADLDDEQAVPPAYLTTVTQQLDAKVAEADASATEAATSAALAKSVANIDTPDALVATLVQDSGSDTGAALSATFVPRRMEGFASAQGAVCFTWDDGFPNWIDIATEAASRGQRHTFCVTSSFIDVNGGIPSADVLAIHNMGHEIAAHSVTHGNHASMTSAQRATEFDTSKAALEAIIGAGNVTTYVYPYGSTGGGRNNTCDREVYGRFERVRDTNGTGLMPMEQRWGTFLIPSKSWVQADVLSSIRMARSQPVIFNVFAHHPDGLIGGSPDVTMAQVIAAMDLADALGVPCVTMREAYPSGGMLADPNFDSGSIGAWRTMGDAGAVTVVPMVNPPAGIKATHCLRITPTTAQECAGRQLIPVTPGKTYEIGYLMRVGANGAGGTMTGATAYARWGTSTDYVGTVGGWQDGTPIAGRTHFVNATTGDRSGAWQLMGGRYTIPAGQRFVEVRLMIVGAAGQTVEFSHVWFGESHLGNFA